MKRIQEILSMVPKSNYNVLRFIIRFLKEMSGLSDKTMMGAHNLALMFAPNLARPGKVKTDATLGISTAHEFVEELIAKYDRIFPQ